MSAEMPAYLSVNRDQLGESVPVKVRIRGDVQDIADDVARVMVETVMRAEEEGRSATLIVPVGPVDQFPVLADLINENRYDWRDVVLINMDEYLTDDDRWVDVDHPLGFRGFMNRKFYDLLDPAQIRKFAENDVIEVAPLAYMRGRTLSDAFIILDEAQNTTPGQMKMFLTRMGEGSRCVVTGDDTQIDLPNPGSSGLLHAARVLKKVKGVRFCRFGQGDIVRHPVVQRIVDAYEKER